MFTEQGCVQAGLDLRLGRWPTPGPLPSFPVCQSRPVCKMRGSVLCLAKGLPSDWDTSGGQCQGNGLEEVLVSLLGLLLQAVGL